MAPEEMQSRQTQHMSCRRLCALAALFVAVTWSTASCGGHVEAASPPSDPVDELSQHGGGFCPAALPRTPRASLPPGPGRGARRETYVLGAEDRAAAVPSLWKPQQAWLCRCVSQN